MIILAALCANSVEHNEAPGRNNTCTQSSFVQVEVDVCEQFLQLGIHQPLHAE